MKQLHSSRKSKIENNGSRNFFTIGEQPVKLWKQLDAEKLVRKRGGWWSKEKYYPDRGQ